MTKTVAVAVALGTMVNVGMARAADISIAGRKLVIQDKVAASGKAKATFVAKDPAITKGAGTDATQISAQLDVSYDAANGTFLAPQGAGWLSNTASVAKYRNRTAPTGGSTKSAQIRPAKMLKLSAKSLGDTPIDISAPPSAGVLAVYTVTNGAETNRHCTSFTLCTHKLLAGGTGYKLTCKEGVPAACPVIPTTTTSTTARDDDDHDDVPATTTTTRAADDDDHDDAPRPRRAADDDDHDDDHDHDHRADDHDDARRPRPRADDHADDDHDDVDDHDHGADDHHHDDDAATTTTTTTDRPRPRRRPRPPPRRPPRRPRRAPPRRRRFRRSRVPRTRRVAAP